MLTLRGEGIRQFLATEDIDEYERFVRADLEFCREMEFQWISNSYGFLWQLSYWRGAWDEALVHAKAALDLEPVGGFQGWAWGSVFHTLASLGRHDEAMVMFEEARSRLPVPGRAATWGSLAILHNAVEGLALLGERAEAATLYPLVLDSTRTGALFLRAYDRRLTQTLAGVAAHMGGLWSEAEQHFIAALEQAERLRLGPEPAHVRRFHARMLLDRDAPGDRERARSLLTSALEAFRAAAMPRHVEETEAFLAGIRPATG
jgi:tetratricopeptide (TPR) repeat protein